MQQELYRKLLLFWQYYQKSLQESLIVFQVSQALNVNVILYIC